MSMLGKYRLDKSTYKLSKYNRKMLLLIGYLVITPVGIVGMQDISGWAELVEESFSPCLAGIAVSHVIPRSYFAMGLGIACALPMTYAIGRRIVYGDMLVKLGQAALRAKANVELLLNDSAHQKVQDPEEIPFFKQAVKLDLVETVESMLAGTGHKKNWKSSTLCDAASCWRSADMVALLVKHGAELQRYELAFYAAVKKGDRNVRTVQLFLDAGVAFDRRAFKSPDWTIVDVAAHYGHVEIVSRLLEAGAQPNPSIVQHVNNRDVLNVLADYGVIDRRQQEEPALLCRRTDAEEKAAAARRELVALDRTWHRCPWGHKRTIVIS